MTISEFINKVGFKVKNEDVRKVNDTISGIKKTAVTLLGALGVGFSLAGINSLIEEFAAVNNGIRDAVGGLEKMSDAQKKILSGANEARISYGSMAATVSNLVKSSPDMFPVDEAVEYAETVTKLLKTAGRSEAEIASISDALNKSFQKGVVDTETINVLLEQSPEAANMLARHLGAAKTELIDMASDGRMSLADLKEAFLSSADEIDSAFQNVDMTVSDALLNIKNRWGLWLAETDKTLGVTKTLSKLMVSGFNMIIGLLNKARTAAVWLSEKFSGMQNLLKMIAVTAGAFYIALNGSKILDFLKSAGSLLSGIKLKSLAIVAVIVLLALLIDDFIHFMKGNDSVLGTLLANAGVDVDAFRKKVIKIWNNIKTILSAVWVGIKNVAIPIFKSIGAAVKGVFLSIGRIIEKIAPQFADFIKDIADGNVDTEKWTSLGEAIASIAAVVLALVAAFKVYSAVMAVVNAVMSASPITWIILAIIALIAVIVLCVKHWDKIKSAFLSAWEKIKGAWSVVIDFFKGIWYGIIGIFSGAGAWFSSLFSGAWEGIKGVWSSVVEWFQGVWDGIVSVFSSVGSWFTDLFSGAWERIKGVFSKVGEFFKGVWNTIVGLFTSIGTAVGDAISGAVKSAINAVLSGAIGIINGFIGAINAVIGVINAIPGVKIGQLNKLEVPQLAEGGYVEANNPQAVIVGDNKREGEIVSPISKMRKTFLDAMRFFVASAHPTSSVKTLSTVTSNRSVVQNVNINNQFSGDRDTQKKTSTAMDKSAKDATSELARGLAFAR